MTGPELYTNPDHRVWAAEFCRACREKGFDPASEDDQDWVAGWIANAMMHGHDHALGTFPIVLPDGSAFFVAEVGK